MSLRILHTLGWYFPESSGGSEIYVHSLARGLASRGISSLVAAPQRGHGEANYEYGGISVYRYPLPAGGSAAQERGYIAPAGFDVFSRWLEKQKGALYHQHAFTLGCGLDHLRAARRLGFKTVLTLHTAGSFCLRGSMMRNGEQACDGRIDTVRCGECWGRSRGLPPAAAAFISRIPAMVSRGFEPASARFRWATALATTAFVNHHRNRFLELMSLADRVVVPCQWMADALQTNGVEEHKIFRCRQGVVWDKVDAPSRTRSATGVLRVGYIGRCSDEKGIDLLIRAVQALPLQLPVQLILSVTTSDDRQQTYRRYLEHLGAGDPRIVWEKTMNRDQVLAGLQSLDVLAVPSQVMETGPLVVYEAFAAGVPVLGSNLGGIAELVTADGNGDLLPHDRIEAWSRRIEQLAHDRSILARWRRDIPAPRRMDQVAEEMAALYRELLS